MPVCEPGYEVSVAHRLVAVAQQLAHQVEAIPHGFDDRGIGIEPGLDPFGAALLGSGEGFRTLLRLHRLAGCQDGASVFLHPCRVDSRAGEHRRLMVGQVPRLAGRKVEQLRRADLAAIEHAEQVEFIGDHLRRRQRGGNLARQRQHDPIPWRRVRVVVAGVERAGPAQSPSTALPPP